MFYLLTEPQIKKIKREYWTRMFNLLTVSLFVVLLIAICLATPTIVRIYSELSALNSRIEPLQNEISTAEIEVAREGVSKILSDVEILNLPDKVDISKIYHRFVEVVESVPGAKIQTLNINTLSKSIQTVLLVRDKEVAQALVKRLTEEKYTGANLPYTVLSEKSTFTFNQKLSYENL